MPEPMTREQALRKLLEQASVGMTLASDLLKHGYQQPNMIELASSLGSAYMQSDATWVTALDTLTNENQVREPIPEELQTRDPSTKIGALNVLLDQQGMIHNVADRLRRGQGPKRIGAAMTASNITRLPKLARAALTLNDELGLTDEEWKALDELKDAAELQSGMSDKQLYETIWERFQNLVFAKDSSDISEDIHNVSSGALGAFLQDGDQRLIKLAQRHLDDPELKAVIVSRSDDIMNAVNAFNGVDLAKEMIASQWQSHEQTVLPTAVQLFNEAVTNPRAPTVRGDDGIRRLDLPRVFREHRDPERVIQSPAVRSINSCDLHRCNFSQLQTNRMSLQGFSFREATFPRGTAMVHSDLRGTDFTDARVEKDLNLTGSVLDPKALETLLPSIKRANARIPPLPAIDNRKILLNVRLVGDFSGMDFSGLDMRGVDLQDADITRVNLEGTRLEMANVRVNQLATASNIDKADFGQDLMLQHASGQRSLPEAALEIKRKQDLTRVANRIVMRAEEGVLEIPLLYGPAATFDLPAKERHLEPKTRDIIVETIADQLYQNIWVDHDLSAEKRQSYHTALVHDHPIPFGNEMKASFTDVAASELLNSENIKLAEKKQSRLKKSASSLISRKKPSAENNVTLASGDIDSIVDSVNGALYHFVQAHDEHQAEQEQAAKAEPQPGMFSRAFSSVKQVLGMMSRDMVESASDMPTTNILPEATASIPGKVTRTLRQWVGTEPANNPEEERRKTIKDTVHEGVRQAIMEDREGPLIKKGAKLQRNFTQMVMEETKHVTVTSTQLPEGTSASIAKTLRDHKVVESTLNPDADNKVKNTSVSRSSGSSSRSSASSSRSTNTGMSWATKVTADKLEQQKSPQQHQH